MTLQCRPQRGRCPEEQLSDPGGVFPFIDTEEVRERVAKECKKLLHRDEPPRDRAGIYVSNAPNITIL